METNLRKKKRKINKKGEILRENSPAEIGFGTLKLFSHQRNKVRENNSMSVNVVAFVIDDLLGVKL